MKANAPLLPENYLTALRKHLKPTASASHVAARALSIQAVQQGLETLDVARMHEEAVVKLMLREYSARTSHAMMQRAGTFFTEVISPIEETHRGAREALVHLNAMIGTLTQRTEELAASNEELKREIAGREAVEKSLKCSEETTSQLLAHSRQMQEALRHLSRQLLTAQEEARRRISRELQNGIAKALTNINGRLAALKQESTVNTRALQLKIAGTQKLVQQSVDTVHRFARELRPSVLDDLGLIPALETFIARYKKDTGVRVILKAAASIEIPDSIRRTVLYRVAEAALTNVVRHAGASRAVVGIQRRAGRIRMEITDDGQGFAVNGHSVVPLHHGPGLLGMSERVEMIGGTFHIESAPGRHTTVRVELPDVAKKPLVKKAAASLFNL